MEALIIIIVIALIFWMIRANKRGKAAWKIVIHVGLDCFEEEEAQKTAAIMREIYENKNGPFDYKHPAIRSIEYANIFIIAILSLICTAAKGNHQKYDIKNISCIIAEDAELYSKLYNAYKATIDIANKQENMFDNEQIYVLPNTEFIHALRAMRNV